MNNMLPKIDPSLKSVRDHARSELDRKIIFLQAIWLSKKDIIELQKDKYNDFDEIYWNKLPELQKANTFNDDSFSEWVRETCIERLQKFSRMHTFVGSYLC